MSDLEIAVRQPWVVLLWSFGLFLFIHLHQYLGGILAARRSGQTLDAIMSGRHQDHTTVLAKGLTTFVVGIPLTWIAVLLLWRRPIDWMGLRFDGGLLFAGLGLGLVLPVLVALVLKLLGKASIWKSLGMSNRRERVAMLLGIGCMALFTGFAEEVVFRGMATREFAHTWGWPLATLVGGAYFGLVHLISRIKTLTVRSALTIMVASVAVSFLFVAMYTHSGSLWLPIGFHAAWNFSLVGILGLPLNGKTTTAGLLEIRLDDSSWWTGGPAGNAGLEVSPVAIAAYLVVGLLFIAF